jgi:hypothetical protein
LAGLFPLPGEVVALFNVQCAGSVACESVSPSNETAVLLVEADPKCTFGAGMLKAFALPHETPKMWAAAPFLISTASLDPAIEKTVPLK